MYIMFFLFIIYFYVFEVNIYNNFMFFLVEGTLVWNEMMECYVI